MRLFGPILMCDDVESRPKLRGGSMLIRSRAMRAMLAEVVYCGGLTTSAGFSHCKCWTYLELLSECTLIQRGGSEKYVPNKKVFGEFAFWCERRTSLKITLLPRPLCVYCLPNLISDVPSSIVSIKYVIAFEPNPASAATLRVKSCA